ncbi:MAG: IPT/TIG domain-containing protein [Calditrichaeota bacterium]|nr:IPT/TIG domain-containing protein [Calditrichota bacterium]
MNVYKLLILLGILAFLGVFYVSCEGPDQPTYGEDVQDPNPTGMPAASIDSISPDEGFLKDKVMIYGSGFNENPEYNLVAFGKRTAVILSVTSNMLEVITPNLSGETVDVKVAVKGSEFWSNQLPFIFKETVQTIDEEIVWPNGVAVDATGNVYIGSAADGVIYQIAPDGAKTTFASVPVNGSIEFGPENYLYVCEQGEGKIARISPDGSTIEDYVVVDAPIDFDWDADGNMYIVSNWSGVFRRDGSGTVTQVATIDNPKCIRVFESNIYVTDIWNDQILKYDITSSGLENETPVVEGITALGIEFDVNGTMYYTHAWETSLYTLAPDGTEEVLYEGQLMTPMHYLTFYDKTMYIVYPGWGDVGQTMKAYIGVEQAPNYGRP